MMLTHARAIGLCLVAALAVPLAGVRPADAQMPGQEPDYYPLGGLGVQGELDGGHFAIRSVFSGGPADRAGLRDGDVIVGVDGRELPEGRDPVLALEAAIEEAEAQRRRNRVPLVIRRGGESHEVEVPVASLGEHGRRCPRGCDKCHRLAAAALEWLADAQRGNGAVPTDLGGTNGLVVVTSLAGLAWLAGGSTPSRGPYSDNLRRAVEYVMSNAGEEGPMGGMGGGRGGGRGAGGNWNQTNWALSYGGYFLAEVYAASPSQEVGQRLSEVVGTLIQNQEESGGWAHGPGGPNALGYVELEIMSNWALAALGGAMRCGLEVPEEPLSRAIEYIQECAGSGGGIGYSTRSGQQGMGEAGRTSGAIFAFAMLGQERHPFYDRMASYFTRNLEEIPAGHVSPTMHYMTGALAAARLGRDAWRRYVDQFRPYWMSTRRPDGSFAARPTEESRAMRSNTDRTLGGGWTTSTMAIILLLPEGNLTLSLGGEVEGGGGGSRPSTGR